MKTTKITKLLGATLAAAMLLLNGCGGGGGASGGSSTTLTTPKNPASIQFVSAEPNTIVLKETGSAGFQESSIVKFKVLDNNNQGVASVDVKLYLSLDTGGILLDGSPSAISLATAITKQTDENGEIDISVRSGTVPTPVWVYAVIPSTTLLTQSNTLTISTGHPTQDRFSLSIETFNIEGLKFDGVTSAVTARTSDRLGNPVPDGTAVNFISGGGQIGASCQTTAGACSVTFTSGNPRLQGNIGIVAYTVGKESFIDSNNNNKYDTGELFTDIGDAFLNLDGLDNFNASTDLQIIYKAGTSGVCTLPHTVQMVPNTCDLAWGSAHVRGSGIIVMSGSTPKAFTNVSTVSSANFCESKTTFLLSDENGNAMPSATTIEVGTTSLGTTTLSSDKVPNTAAQGTEHTVTLTRIAVDDPATVPVETTCSSAVGLTLPLKITTPKQIVTTLYLTL